jgi:DNA-binding MarR family transcriptional regulator
VTRRQPPAPPPPPNSAASRNEAADALAAVAPLASRWIERLLAGHSPPLTVSQYLALRAIAGEDVSGGELARRAGVSGSAVSQLLSGLVDAGLVARGEVAGDRRRRQLQLTAVGRDTLTRAADMLREQLATLLTDVPPPEADALARLLPHVEAALSGTAPPRRPPPPPRPPNGPPEPPPQPQPR